LAAAEPANQLALILKEGTARATEAQHAKTNAARIMVEAVNSSLGRE